jgi:hypothetical protein
MQQWGRFKQFAEEKKGQRRRTEKKEQRRRVTSHNLTIDGRNRERTEKKGHISQFDN